MTDLLFTQNYAIQRWILCQFTKLEKNSGVWKTDKPKVTPLNSLYTGRLLLIGT
jgi:hypothetical protein